jgi:hypothetical protein
MRKLRLVLLAAALTASTMALPAYAQGGGPGGGGGGNGGGGATVSFRTFRMAGALFSTSNPALLSGGMQYTLDPTGRARLVVGYLNTAGLPAGTALDVLADGVRVGGLVTSAQGGAATITAGLPALTLQSRISLAAAGTEVASGAFTLNI